MKGLARRLLAVLLAALLLSSLFASLAHAEDWRGMLRDMFGLEDEGDSASYDGDREGSEADGDRWQLPITDPQQIVNYLDAYGELPENFLTKKEARQRGWDSSYNYVGEVAPGMSIGGDRFGNYEGLLPEKKGRTWYECDANYRGKKRGAERVLYSSDGLYYYTNDHYQTLTQLFPEG